MLQMKMTRSLCPFANVLVLYIRRLPVLLLGRSITADRPVTCTNLRRARGAETLLSRLQGGRGRW